MNNTTKEKQHTVPRFILKNFSVNGKIYTYDKYIGKAYCSNVKDSGCEKSFYDFKIKIDNKTVEGSIEEKLCELESNASRVIRKILKHDTVANLTDEEKEHMNHFLAAQMMRTQNSKLNFQLMPKQLRNALKQRMSNLDSDDLNIKVPDFDNDNLNLCFDYLIANSTERLRPYFRGLEWILVKTDEVNPFIIGDSPVVVYNELYYDKEESFQFSKYAIGYKGCCVFFPLSPTRALWLVSPEVIEKYVQSNKKLLKLFFLGIKFSENVCKMGSKVQNFIDIEVGFTKTKIISFPSEYVLKYNYFEIISAERKVFSNVSSFEKVEELIKENEFYRHGRRVVCR